MKKHLIYGMSVKDWEKLGKMMNPEPANYTSRVYTYGELLHMDKIKIESFRVSKKGVKLITFSNGIEIPIEHVERTNCYTI